MILVRKININIKFSKFSTSWFNSQVIAIGVRLFNAFNRNRIERTFCQMFYCLSAPQSQAGVSRISFIKDMSGPVMYNPCLLQLMFARKIEASWWITRAKYHSFVRINFLQTSKLIHMWNGNHLGCKKNVFCMQIRETARFLTMHVEDHCDMYQF